MTKWIQTVNYLHRQQKQVIVVSVPCAPCSVDNTELKKPDDRW